jgi:hypothetical protein
MAKHTHRLRPKGTDKWEYVTAEQLAAIAKQVGERTLKANYQVEEMADRPDALPTTSTKTKDTPKPEGEPK